MSGTVYERKDGRWVSALTIDGKRTVRYSQTEDEAIDKLREMGGTPREGQTVTDILRGALEDSDCECGELHAEDLRALLVERGVRLVPYRHASTPWVHPRLGVAALKRSWDPTDTPEPDPPPL